MSKKIFWVDIPKAPLAILDRGEWINIGKFDTKEEAVAFIRRFIDGNCSEDGVISSLISEGEDYEEGGR